MAEPTAAASAEIAASEWDALLATKLHVPGPGQGLVPRPRLAERLNEELSRGLALVCAPAGYGKTVLLAEWTRSGQHPAAWLSLDAGDNEPAGSGATPSPRWTGHARGSAGGSARCLARPRPRRSAGL